MKKLLIARRTATGWTPYSVNKDRQHCDWCGETLWVAPDGKTLYCDSVHYVTVLQSA